MKARKAVIAGMLAASAAQSLLVQPQAGFASEETPETVLSVEYAAADTEGNFSVRVLLDELPDSGLCALDFAIGYDPALLNIGQVRLLYDTGAQEAEILADPKLAGTVFTYEEYADVPGEMRFKWATALQDPDYWLREERPFFEISGTLSAEMQGGTAAVLSVIAPAQRAGGEDDSGDSGQNVMKAGYLDELGNIYSCSVRGNDGLLWKPLDETGATMYGDIDLNGKHTVSDAVLMMRAIAEEKALSAAAYANADCVPDGVLTIADVTLMLQMIDADEE